MQCSRCGAGIPPGQRACPRCGSAPAPPANVFEQAERRALLAQAEYLRGALSESGYRDELYRLIVRDLRGVHWSFVPDVGWHRHDGQHWVRSDPPEGLPPPAPAAAPSAQPPPRAHARPRWLLLALAAVAAVSLLCVCGSGVAWFLYQRRGGEPSPATVAPVGAVSGPGSAIVVATAAAPVSEGTMAGLSADQRQVLTAFGWPHAFAIMEIDGPDGSTMRQEQWSYYDARVSYCFVDGTFVRWEPVADAPAAIVPTQYRPNQFALGATLEQAQTAGGAPWEAVPDVGGLLTGADTFVAEQLMAGFRDGRLVVLEAFAVTPRGGR